MQFLAFLQTKVWFLIRFAAALVLLTLVILAGAGLALNNADALGLNDIQIQSPAFLHKEPSQNSHIIANYTGGHWYYRYEKSLYQDSLPWEECLGDFVGAHQQASYLVVACSYELLLFDKFDRLVERVNDNYGLPPEIDSLGYVGEQIFIGSGLRVFNIDLESMELYEALSSNNISWVKLQHLPRQFIDTLYEEQTNSADIVLNDMFQYMLLSKQAKPFIDALLILAALVLLALIWILLWYREPEHEAIYFAGDLERELNGE